MSTETNPKATYTPHMNGFMMWAIEADGYGGFVVTTSSGHAWVYANYNDFAGTPGEALRAAYMAVVEAAYDLSALHESGDPSSYKPADGVTITPLPA